jgi:hypothetical protein
MLSFISKTWNGIKMYLGNKEETYNRILLFARASILLNAVIGLGKTIKGFYSHSFIFVCSGFYNLCIALAKIVAVKGYAESKGKAVWPFVQHTDRSGKRKEHRYYRQVGFIVLLASLVYTIGSTRVLFFGRNKAHYSLIWVIEIGTVTAVEIIISIYGVLARRREKEPILEAIKTTSLISSLIGLVLVQTAILGQSGTEPIVYFDYVGVALGTISFFIAIYMLVTANGKIDRKNARFKLE